MTKKNVDQLTARAAIDLLKQEIDKGNVSPHEVIGILEHVAATMEKWAFNDASKTKVTNNLLFAYHRIATFGEIAASVAKQVNKARSYMKEVVIPERFETEDSKTITMDELGMRFTVSSQLRASIKSGMKDDALVWFREHELADIIQETVNASTLGALARDMVAENKELPEDLFNTQVFNNTSMTKTK